MPLIVANNAYGVLQFGMTKTDTTVTLEFGHGARFPMMSSGDYSYGTLFDDGNNREIVKITGRTGDVLTIERAQDNTEARVFSPGDRLEMRPVAAMYGTFVTKDLVTEELGNSLVKVPSEAAVKNAIPMVVDYEGTNEDYVMSQEAVSRLYGQMSAIGQTTLNRDANSITFTDIRSKLALEVGDVISIVGSSQSDQLYMVEAIPNDNTIWVNREHRGGLGPKALFNETATMVIGRVAKWYLAPHGLGQGWVKIQGRLKNTDYFNNTQRTISTSMYITTSKGNTAEATIFVDGVVVGRANHASGEPWGNACVYAEVPPGSKVKYDWIGTVDGIVELR